MMVKKLRIEVLQQQQLIIWCPLGRVVSCHRCPVVLARSPVVFLLRAVGREGSGYDSSNASRLFLIKLCNLDLLAQ